ncbi:hypothetical protein G7Y89_g9502 [Cudoniella acicularis]|uniref:Uncharacterized protein n=1 Tax=Cudoniella acicularis TaxID=354080 RepID=A0A8H4RI88_9HELO|nr:hypothetical protein G7Y89_g9502 [Cudoniella acicularis]
MGRKKQAEEDQWFGVLDPKKRKQIQDRLAQRARRKRLAGSVKGGESPSKAQSAVVIKKSSRGRTNSTTSPEEITTIESNQSSAYVDIIKVSPVPSISHDHRHISPSHSVYSALFCNGVILGLPCGVPNIGRSLPPKECTPPSLRPSKLQLEVVHYQWIDRFPLPILRDKMIYLSDSFSTEDFLGDLFSCIEPFTIRKGAESWDASAWRVTDGFRKKLSEVTTPDPDETEQSIYLPPILQHTKRLDPSINNNDNYRECSDAAITRSQEFLRGRFARWLAENPNPLAGKLGGHNSNREVLPIREADGKTMTWGEFAEEMALKIAATNQPDNVDDCWFVDRKNEGSQCEIPLENPCDHTNHENICWFQDQYGEEDRSGYPEQFVSFSSVPVVYRVCRLLQLLKIGSAFPIPEGDYDHRCQRGRFQSFACVTYRKRAPDPELHPKECGGLFERFACVNPDHIAMKRPGNPRNACINRIRVMCMHNPMCVSTDKWGRRQLCRDGHLRYGLGVCNCGRGCFVEVEDLEVPSSLPRRRRRRLLHSNLNFGDLDDRSIDSSIS